MKKYPKPLAFLVGAFIGAVLGLVVFVLAWCVAPDEVTSSGLLRTQIAFSLVGGLFAFFSTFLDSP